MTLLSPTRSPSYLPKQFSLRALLVLFTLAAPLIWCFTPPSDGQIWKWNARKVKTGTSKQQVIDVIGKDTKVEWGEVITLANQKDYWLYRVWNAPFPDQSLVVKFDRINDRVESVEFKPWRSVFK